MLVLSRTVGEQVVIDGRIRVTVTALSDGRVKLGVVAPADVRVDRAEVARDGTAPPAQPR